MDRKVFNNADEFHEALVELEKVCQYCDQSYNNCSCLTNL